MYTAHKNKITAVKQTPNFKDYAFGDEHGTVTIFEHTAGQEKVNIKRNHMMLVGNINDLEWVQYTMDGRCKIIAIGDA